MSHPGLSYLAITFGRGRQAGRRSIVLARAEKVAMVLVAVDALQEREIARARGRERAVCVCV